MEWFHGALDVVGMVPILVEPADAVNGTIYLFEGDWGNAAISGGAVVPWFGSAGTSVRIAGRHGDEVLDALGGAARHGDAATDIARYDPDFAIGQIASGGNARASDLLDFGSSQGWQRTQTATGPIKFVDDNGVTRLTIKNGSPRAPGSALPHIEIRNAAGQRIDVYGNHVTRRSPGNHTSIVWDLGR